MSEWTVERGIGEVRAALIEDGRIVEAHVERDGAGLRAGAVRRAKLTGRVGRRGVAAVVGEEIVLGYVPRGVTEGQSLAVEVVREALPEAGRAKRALGVPTDRAEGDPPPRWPDAAPLAAHAEDRLEAAGWSEVVEEARSGLIDFPGGTLAVALTPAMTMIDVDGGGDAAVLAEHAATAAGRAIRRHGLAGSIGIDFPTLGDRAARQRVAAALDAALPQPFERTAVNGFGFLQIVRRRTQASLFEMVQFAPVETAALALLRRAERTPGLGACVLTAAPVVTAWLDAHPALVNELHRRVGVTVRLQADAALAISGGHVARAQIQ
jgi:Ribonuclease E/G family